MKINCIPLGEIQTNCYLIESENVAFVIDPGFKSAEVEDFLIKNSEKERMILLTHCHFDHIGGVPDLVKKTGVKVAIGEKENDSLADKTINLCNLFGENIAPFSADLLLKDGEVVCVGDIKITVMHTPGHTAGSVVYLIEDYLFSGDTLFCLSVGRTDFPQGNFAQLADSVKKLYQLDGNIKVLSGHGRQSTILYEKQFNPYV